MSSHYPPYPCCGGLVFHTDSCEVKVTRDYRLDRFGAECGHGNLPTECRDCEIHKLRAQLAEAQKWRDSEERAASSSAEVVNLQVQLAAKDKLIEEARAGLVATEKHVRALAFAMPPPNQYTPRFLEICEAINAFLAKLGA